ncbi:hypothetical protein [Burkholderia gladioli]|uniref:hypothetical protein n=1 Tax=Burkholderia gladioli TaxID=28095 RepID=UPI001640A019|nr:hypothetical protein [Burkholderia gladioli]
MNQKVTVRPQGAAVEAPAAPLTPSQTVISQGASEVTVVDTAGRTIVLRKPGPLARLRFIDAMGESSANKLWAGTVWPLMFVLSIDGVPVPPPAQKAQIEALYQRLDEHGYEALSEGVSAHFSAEQSSVDEDLAKKS